MRRLQSSALSIGLQNVQNIESTQTELPRGKHIRRTQTGIAGFDSLIQGGIPTDSFIILGGKTGTGKSIFGINFLDYGAKNGEAGVYVSLEENYLENKQQMSMFGWDLDALQQEKKLLVIQPRMYSFDKLVESITDAVHSIGAKRLVIDSISLIELYFEDSFVTRRSIVNLANSLKKLGVTTLAICESNGHGENISKNGIEEFVSDGIISLNIERKENCMKRSICISKMRSTSHSMMIHPLKIENEKGISVHPVKEMSHEC